MIKAHRHGNSVNNNIRECIKLTRNFNEVFDQFGPFNYLRFAANFAHDPKHLLVDQLHTHTHICIK